MRGGGIYILRSLLSSVIRSRSTSSGMSDWPPVDSTKLRSGSLRSSDARCMIVDVVERSRSILLYLDEGFVRSIVFGSVNMGKS